MALLTDERARRTMASAGLRRVRERFSVERMVRDTLRVYERAVRECATRGPLKVPRFQGSFSATQPGTAAGVDARTIVEGDRRAVPGERHAASDPAGRRAIRLEQADGAKIGAGARVEDPQLIAVHRNATRPPSGVQAI